GWCAGVGRFAVWCRRGGRGPGTPPSGTVARACRGCAADAPWRPQRPPVRRRVMRGEGRSGGQDARSGPAFAATDGAWRDRRPAARAVATATGPAARRTPPPPAPPTPHTHAPRAADPLAPADTAPAPPAPPPRPPPPPHRPPPARPPSRTPERWHPAALPAG